MIPLRSITRVAARNAGFSRAKSSLPLTKVSPQSFEATSSNPASPPKAAIYLGLMVGTSGIAAAIWEDSHQDTPTYWHDKPIPVTVRQRKTSDYFALEREPLEKQVFWHNEESVPVKNKSHHTASDWFSLNTEES